jgi:hypothetical protein
VYSAYWGDLNPLVNDIDDAKNKGSETAQFVTDLIID